jgi:hypothetical protein
MGNDRRIWLLGALLALISGCAAFPDVVHQPQYHNPFPQLYRVAILPFYNQSSDPHLNGIRVAEAYYQELQQIPGFEVMPVGTALRALEALPEEPRSGEDFQRLARELGVDVVLVGAITDYTAYYPPRIGLAVNWYAANPGFHPIPVGYGLPWGTSEEEYIPSNLVHAAEFELAREQLTTQTPRSEEGAAESAARRDPPRGKSAKSPTPARRPNLAANLEKPKAAKPPFNVLRATHVAENPPEPDAMPGEQADEIPLEELPAAIPSKPTATHAVRQPPLPENWPDPRGFVPPPPQLRPPKAAPQSGPVITHTRLFEGADADLTEALANYVYFRDDARFGGWQAYLQRSDDFLRFCCYLHITETLAARGGTGETRVVWRWPIGRYER